MLRTQERGIPAGESEKKTGTLAEVAKILGQDGASG